MSNRLLKNVTSETETRQKWEKNCSLHRANKNFEPIFNAVFAGVVIFFISLPNALANKKIGGLLAPNFYK